MMNKIMFPHFHLRHMEGPKWIDLNISSIHAKFPSHMASKILVSNGSDNGLLPDGTKPLPEAMFISSLFMPFRTHFNEISSEIYTFSFKKMYLNMFSAKCKPFCSSLSLLHNQSIK